MAGAVEGVQPPGPDCLHHQVAGGLDDRSSAASLCSKGGCQATSDTSLLTDAHGLAGLTPDPSVTEGHVIPHQAEAPDAGEPVDGAPEPPDPGDQALGQGGELRGVTQRQCCNTHIIIFLSQSRIFILVETKCYIGKQECRFPCC